MVHNLKVISQKTVDVPSHLWYPKACDGRSLFFVCKNEPRKRLQASCTCRFQTGKDMLAWIYGVKSVCGKKVAKRISYAANAATTSGYAR